MGEVFLAHDASLDRKVALKFLPDIFSGDPERLARFEREAKLLASLNHPNIATIYGLEQADGKRFLAMELVEGETLAQQIERGPMPVDEALEVCRQIAEGLEAAHEKGIIHRDLKPANVKITPEGKVKILDFGLAKALQGETSAVDVSKSPTLTDQMTHAGVILGTAAYMAPEQAKGRVVDKRADIWAFGCIMYECLTGKRPFEGETVTETLAAILKGEPGWQALPFDTPTHIPVLIRRCLRKDPRERLHDIADARLEITEASGQPVIPATLPPERSSGTKSTAIMLALVALTATAASIITWYLKPVPPAMPVRSTIEFPGDLRLPYETSDAGGRRWVWQGPIRTDISLSPDGKLLVFSASPDGSEGKAMLYRRELGEDTVSAIDGTQGARTPFFSPDGKTIGFWADRQLRKVPSDGGIPDKICNFDILPAGINWGSNGQIAIGTYGAGLQMVNANGSEPATLTNTDTSKELTHRLPWFLPGGKALLFTSMPDYWGVRAQIEALELATGKRKILIPDGADARYLPPGYLVYMKEGALMAARFDARRLEIYGPAVPVNKGVLQAINEAGSIQNSGAGQYAFSENGTLIFAAGGIFPDYEYQWYWIDRTGKADPATNFPKGPNVAARISPTNPSEELFYVTAGKNGRIWLHNLKSGTTKPLTAPEWRVLATPAWTRDGKRMSFSYARAGVFNIWWMDAEGINPPEKLISDNVFMWAGSWSPDDKIFAYLSGTAQTGYDICTYDVDARQHKIYMSTPEWNESVPEISPDGQWIAYGSTESKSWEVWINSFPKPGRRIPISKGGGMEPVWSPDGREVFYWNPERTRLLGTKLDPSAGMKPVSTEEVARFDYGGSSPNRNYDISPDGKRFLVLQRRQVNPILVNRLKLVQNWIGEVESLLSVGK